VPTVSVVASVLDVTSRVGRGDLAAVAIDIPIGLPERGARACDVQARALLGPRRSSVFPAPLRAIVGCSTWLEAGAKARAIDGRGISRQVFNLLPKIAEVDGAISPARQLQVVEAHPELCFASMAGAPLAASKRSADGRGAREALVRAPASRPSGAAPDDVLDALAVLWTARRLACGREDRLGDGARDARGLRMEIVR
jgi:predicted RNase H-like nuclease